MDLSQGRVFGKAAEAYDRVRPGYPAEVVDRLLACAGGGARILEVGCGTGQATRALAAGAREVVALEPDERMAALARRRCAGLPRVRVEVAAFEEWALPPEPFDLLVSAQAWHWVDAGVRTAKAAEALRAGGWLAVMWNQPRLADEVVWQVLDAAYRRHAPQLAGRRPGTRVATVVGEVAGETETCADFGPVSEHAVAWHDELRPDEFVAWLATQSHHLRLEAGARRGLLAQVEAGVAERASVAIAYTCRLLLAPRLDG